MLTEKLAAPKPNTILWIDEPRALIPAPPSALTVVPEKSDLELPKSHVMFHQPTNQAVNQFTRRDILASLIGIDTHSKEEDRFRQSMRQVEMARTPVRPHAIIEENHSLRDAILVTLSGGIALKVGINTLDNLAQLSRRTDHHLTRRNAIKLGILGGVAGILAACGSSPSAPETPTQWRKTYDRLLSLEKIQGPIPGKYSEFIKQNNLSPRVFEEKDTFEQRIAQTLDYLTRFRNALRNHPEQRGPTFGDLNIVSDKLTPVAIPGNWTIYDLVDAFLAEIEASKTPSATTSTSNFAYLGNSGKSGLNAANTNEYRPYNDKNWVRYSSILLGKSFMSKDGLNYEKDEDKIYTGMTDVTAAGLILHEYFHALQGQQRLQMVIGRNPILRTLGLFDPAGRVGTDFQAMTKFVQQDMYNAENRYLTANLGLPQTVNLHEAQANSAAFLFHHRLNTLNQSETFPGTSFDDPPDELIEIIRGQSGDNSFINLYKLYTQIVIGASDPGRGMAKQWLQAAGY